MKFELLIENDFQIPDAEFKQLFQSIDPSQPYGKLQDINGNIVGAWSLENPYLMIELYPMSGNVLATDSEEVTHWDVLLRHDGGDPIEEYEDLTYDEAEDRIRILESQYPEAITDTQLEDLLQ